MTLARSQTGPCAKAWRPRQRAHWWLASVLVGCLLPASLSHADALRLAERLTQIYLMAPEAIRAESRRVLRKPATDPWPQLARSAPAANFYTSPLGVPAIALTAFLRRGPPEPA
ncbi:hypothetical protein [Salinicola aestuarinus]|uniref:hypothetical protein n=1 Tax=Salinicola aestuarinus TaxID=1949082 RepID=UPI001FDA4C78|nr:hypothetical protein [Salinicola aestuarinus]